METDPLLPFFAVLLTLSNRMITLPPVGLVVPLWLWLLWNLWKSRNKLCFDNRSFTVQVVLHKAITDAKEWQAAQISDPTTTALCVRALIPTTAPHLLNLPSLSGPLGFVDAV